MESKLVPHVACTLISSHTSKINYNYEIYSCMGNYCAVLSIILIVITRSAFMIVLCKI